MANGISLGSTSIFVLGKENVELTIGQSATDKTNAVTGYRIEARLYDFTVIEVKTDASNGTSISVQYSEDNVISKNFTVANGAATTFTTPSSFFSGLSSDKIVKFFIYPQVDFEDKGKEDEEGEPISSDFYLGLHTTSPQLELQQIIWNGNTPEVTIAVKHPGFGYAKFEDSSAEPSYREALYDVLQKLEISGEANGAAISLGVDSEWYNHTEMISSMSFLNGSLFSNNLSYQITIEVSFTGEQKKAWAGPYTLQSNYFLSALISNFVISHNGTAMNIPKDFVPGLTSGLAVSTKANDSKSANSLALYDLFLDGTAYRNQPSISFRQIVKVSDGEGNLDKEVAKIYVEGGNLKIKIGNRTITFAADGNANTTI